MFEPAADPLEIEVLAVPDATLILIAAVIEPLRAANRHLGRELYRWRIVTPDGAPARTTAGVEIPSAGRFDPSAERGPLFVVASYNEPAHASRDLLRRLRQAGRGDRVICGVESGAWLMARAGLFEGRAATVHWEDVDEFAAAFPGVDARTERFVVDGARISAGGATPALDLMLAVIAARQGAAAAVSVSRLFIYEPAASRVQGAGGFDRVAAIDRRVARAMRLMEETIAEPLAVADIADRVGVSARRLQTLFRDVLGVGPREHYLGLRLDAARRLLAETRRPGVEIAERCGFTSSGAFSRAYRIRFGETPSATRRRAGLC